MNRQERDWYNYGRYEGYNNDAHYHAARNLTDEFEQHYRHERGNNNRDRYRPQRSYHEGSEIEEEYNRHNRTRQNYSDRNNTMRRDQDRETNYFGHYNDNQDNYRGDEEFYRENQDQNRQFGDRGVSSGFSDDYGSYNSSRYSGPHNQDYNYSSRNESRNIHYIPDSDEGAYNRSGSNVAGRYSADEYSRYNSGRNRFSSSHWNNDGERVRYY
ncbi:hypothetical protein [Pontibacter fetidus]|uniref:Uncharacterized protein n=1 Tax=Pontibacter fetidus TaxID=2700082 RepID=A0A6B2H4S9_9BACT|nr:hypothetical protein [Pontibacter fetidus]NDK57413.1 hypothetical protein [Pontibacter fetidus]